MSSFESSSPILAKAYDTALLDLDGVVYIGQDAVPGVIGALNQAHDEFGMTLTCVTNNASRSPQRVADHLMQLGLKVSAGDVVTSAQAGASELAKLIPQGSRVFVLGSQDLAREVELVGLLASHDDSLTYDALIQGYWPDMPWRILDFAAEILRSGVPWVVTNMDLTIPTPTGVAPGNGTVVQALGQSVNREPTVVAGKPQTPLMQQSIDRTGAKRPLVVGDRLDTDIHGANNVGVDSLLVLSGVTTLAEILQAPVELRPTYLAWDACEILKPQTAASFADNVASCGGWQVRNSDLIGQGDALDGFKAIALAHWNGDISLANALECLVGIGLEVR
ncbi:MAG: HAD-IIA family hydrolase [Actinomycetes bacterium]